MKDKHKIRALILQEWQAKRTVKQAHENIYRHLGPNAICKPTVRAWYKKFANGSRTFRGGRDEDYDQPLILPSDVYLLGNKAILFNADSWPLAHGFTTNDGRIGFAFAFQHDRPEQRAFVAVDLFHGKWINLTIENDPLRYELGTVYRLTAIDDERLLLEENRLFNRRVYLLHIDQNDWTCQVLDQFDDNDYFTFIFDQPNRDKIATFVEELCHRGRITNNTIALDRTVVPCPDLFFHNLRDVKVRGIKQRRIYGISTFTFVDYNLETGIVEQNIGLPARLDDGTAFDWDPSEVGAYAWSDTAFYMSLVSHKADASIYKLDLSNVTWSKLNITIVGVVTGLFVDENEFLTVSAFETSSNVDRKASKQCQVAVYRFALKRPDSLTNLAWRAIRFFHTFRGSDVYEKLFRRLPYNSYLRCAVPEA